MNKQLSQDRSNTQDILTKTTELAFRYFQQQDELPPSKWVDALAPVSLPLEGMGGEKTLAFFDKHYTQLISGSAGSRYFGFVVGGSTPAAVAGDWLASTYDQNVGGNKEFGPQLERQTIDLLKQLLKIDQDYFGSFVSGATMSNFTSLAIARQWVGEQRGVDFSTDGLTHRIPVLSASPHSSILKSLSMLGIGKNALVKINAQPNREAVDLHHLEQALQDVNGPCIVVANAGTVNTVDFDDLVAIGKLKEKYNFWMHVDAAFGGFAACSGKYSHLVEGINYADSITIDAHKWLNVPYDSAMQFTRHSVLQGKVFSNNAAYLGINTPDFLHYTPENSRRFRALPAWFTLMAYGQKGYEDIIERNCYLAAQLGEFIRDSESYELLSPVRLNVVCFTLKQENLTMAIIQEFLDKVRDDGRVFFSPTVYLGKPAIRAAISNWQTEEKDLEIAVQVLKEMYHEAVSL